jgi:hypothetical protein
MNPELIAIAQAFGDSIKASDYRAAVELLASWLRESVSEDELRSLVERWLDEIAAANGAEDTPTPVAVTVDWNTSTLESLRSGDGGGREISEHVTEANYRGWLCTQIEVEGVAFGGAFDVWMAVVEVSGTPLIGYFSIEEAD